MSISRLKGCHTDHSRIWTESCIWKCCLVDLVQKEIGF